MISLKLIQKEIIKYSSCFSENVQFCLSLKVGRVFLLCCKLWLPFLLPGIPDISSSQRSWLVYFFEVWVSSVFTNVMEALLLGPQSFKDVITLKAMSRRSPLLASLSLAELCLWPHVNSGSMFLQSPDSYWKELNPKSTLCIAFFIPYCCFLTYGSSRNSTKKNSVFNNGPFLIRRHLNIMLTEFYGNYYLLLFYGF